MGPTSVDVDAGIRSKNSKLEKMQVMTRKQEILRMRSPGSKTKWAAG
jgi:hypothetical protein